MRVRTTIPAWAMLCGLAAAAAEQPAVTVTGGLTFGSAATYSVGWRFVPAVPLVVTALGVYDADGGGLSGVHTVRLYDVTHAGVLVTAVVPANAPAESGGGYAAHYVAVTSVTLEAGTTYCVARNRGPDNYRYDATAVIGAGLTWRDGVGCAGDLPPTADGFNIVRTNRSCYFGPTFKVASEAALLEPLARPLPRSVHQRDSNNVARVPVAGACAAGLDRIEARAVVRPGFHGAATDWAVIDAAPGSAFSNRFDLAGGWYDIEVRVVSNGLAVATSRVERVGVGELFVTAGQSNAANHGNPPQHPADERSVACNLTTGAWQPLDDPQPYATGTGGSPWPVFADLLAAWARVPVGVVAVGVGATQVSQWEPPGGHYPRLALAVSALRPYGGCRAILWHEGESDSLAGTAPATYAARLTNIIGQTRAEAGAEVPWGIAYASWHPNSAASNEAKVILGQGLAISNHPAVFKGAETDAFHTRGWLSDSVHFNGEGLRDHGRQWVDAVWRSALSADRDGDGQPDLWMLTRFGHAEGRADDLSRAGDDADGDGISNLDEYRALTDPLGESSRLDITTLAISNGEAAVSWPAVPGQSYRLETASDAGSNDWAAEGSQAAAYSGGEQTASARLSAEQGAGLFRVAVP